MTSIRSRRMLSRCGVTRNSRIHIQSRAGGASCGERRVHAFEEDEICVRVYWPGFLRPACGGVAGPGAGRPDVLRANPPQVPSSLNPPTSNHPSPPATMFRASSSATSMHVLLHPLASSDTLPQPSRGHSGPSYGARLRPYKTPLCDTTEG